MSTQPLSAVESIRPAVDRTEKFMFQPFQWSKWWRIAILGLATGEFASFGGCNFNRMGRIGNFPPSNPIPHPSIPGIGPAQIAAIITVLVVGVAVLVLVHLYIASVLRFVLFDAVAAGRFRLREGWTRWHSRGQRFFLFNISLALISLAGYGVLVGIPLGLAWSTGVLANFREHWGVLLLVALCLLPFVFAFALVMALVYLFAKDFAVPIIALEEITVPDALRRVWAMIRGAKGDFAKYVLMKIAIAIVVGIALAIVEVIGLLILLIPVAIGIAIVVAAAPSLVHSPAMIALAITGILVAVCVVLFVIGVIAVPAVTFYQAYVLNFFGSRYAPLWTLMHPPSTTPPPSELEPPLFLPPDASPA